MAWGAVIGGVTSALGSILGAQSAAAANSANIAMSREQMDFQERMRATQYQTAVQDLMKAGLNPMLAYTQGGAGTPPGSMAVSKPEFDPNAGTNAVNSAAAMTSLINQSKQVAADVRNTDADTANKLADANRIIADTKLKTELAWLNSAKRTTESLRPQLLISQNDLAREQINQISKTLYPTLAKIRADTALSYQSADQIRSQNVLMKELQSNDATKHWAPFLVDILRKR